MQEKHKFFILNCLLILITYVLPLWYLNKYQGKNQYLPLLVVLIGGIILMFNQNRYHKNELKYYILIFKIIGVLGVLYSLIVISLIKSLKNGIG